MWAQAFFKRIGVSSTWTSIGCIGVGILFLLVWKFGWKYFIIWMEKKKSISNKKRKAD